MNGQFRQQGGTNQAHKLRQRAVLLEGLAKLGLDLEALVRRPSKPRGSEAEEGGAMAARLGGNAGEGELVGGPREAKTKNIGARAGASTRTWRRAKKTGNKNTWKRNLSLHLENGFINALGQIFSLEYVLQNII